MTDPLTVDEQIAAHLRRFEGEREKDDYGRVADLNERIDRFIQRARTGNLLRPGEGMLTIGDVVFMKGHAKKMTVVADLQDSQPPKVRCMLYADDGSFEWHDLPVAALARYGD